MVGSKSGPSTNEMTGRHGTASLEDNLITCPYDTLSCSVQSVRVLDLGKNHPIFVPF